MLFQKSRVQNSIEAPLDPQNILLSVTQTGNWRSRNYVFFVISAKFPTLCSGAASGFFRLAFDTWAPFFLNDNNEKNENIM